MAALRLESVSKTYPGPAGGIPAVRELSLDISDGELVVLVGPSGCGKTTTLRMIAGLEEPTCGTVRLGGRPVNGVHPRDRDIAMVFQNYALYPHMTARQNLSFPLRARGVPRPEIDRRVEAAAHILGIQELLDRRPRQLSGGQRQRIALARAIVRKPAAFLFDEPLSNLDPGLRTSTRGELKALHHRLGTTTVYVTHDQEEAMTLGDRIVVMAQGRVQQIGKPLEVYRRPANRFVAGFIGMPAMNFLPGRVEIGVPPSFVESGVTGAVGARIPLAPAAAGVGGLGPRGSTPIADRPLVLGIRPQALRPASRGIFVSVRIVEPLGDWVDLTCSTAAGNPLVARLPAGPEFSPGQGLVLAPDATQIHLFEPGEPGSAL
jgi:ABC-type sugar transport system ATPase subunit